MKLRVNSRGIGNFLLMVLSILFIMHLLVLLGVLDPNIIWDTTITDSASITISGWIAIFFIGLFAFAICLKLNYFPLRRLRRSADSILWIMVLYYSLNIIGIFMSNVPWAKIFYVPLTLIFIVLIVRFIFSKDPEPKRKKGSHKNNVRKRSPQKRGTQKIRRVS